MNAYVEIRSQHAKGTWPKQGPDTYVAVQLVPDGVEPLRCLNQTAAKRRGIRIEYFGEGYRNRTGPSSALGQAIEAAESFAESFGGDHSKTPSLPS